jgi:hypothetical protein
MAADLSPPSSDYFLFLRVSLATFPEDMICPSASLAPDEESITGP